MLGYRVVTVYDVSACLCASSGGFDRFVLVFDILRRYGGVYAPENAIFVRLLDR
jgi:hypothetical protein